MTLVYFLRKRRDIPFPPVFWLFAVFIFTCGFGHLIEATIFWHPWYRFSGLVKCLTALSSWLTVIALVRVTPLAITLPGLARVNEDLANEIAERREIESALRTSEERFRALVETSAQIVWQTAHDGQAIADSPSWRSFTGQTQQRWLGWGRLDAIHPDDRDRTVALWRGADRKEPLQAEYRIRHHSGEWRWTALRAVPLFNEDGSLREWVGMNTDITDRKRSEGEREELLGRLQALNTQLEERVRDRTSELSAALKERDVLIQEIHHRVKNNLQVISSLISMQVRQLDDAKEKDALLVCQTRIQAIALIHEKLYQSKDYGEVPFAHYVRALIRDLVSANGGTSGKIAVSLLLEDVSLPVDRAIPCGLILNELITNAFKHAFNSAHASAGTIRVELAPLPGAQMLLAVSDNGAGIPANFDPAQATTLGLQLVVTLVEQLEGHLEIRREAGTSMRVTFPIPPIRLLTPR